MERKFPGRASSKCKGAEAEPECLPLASSEQLSATSLLSPKGLTSMGCSNGPLALWLPVRSVHGRPSRMSESMNKVRSE